MNLTPPPAETRVIRRIEPRGIWHIAKGSQKTLCGRLLINEDNVEYSTLGEIRKLCPSCWPFGKK